MTRHNLFLLSLMLLAGPALAQQSADALADKSKLSYAVGYDMGMNLKRQNIDLDVDQLIRAIRDTFSEAEPSVPREEMATILSALQQKIRAEQLERFKQLSEENQRKSNAFLADNAQKSGVVSLPSGVQYRVIEEGEGARPKLADAVSIHFRGSKMDGWEFDSTFARAQPEIFKIEDITVPGWQEVLPLMREGATWRVYLPPEMAFGARGNPPIGPNEAVIFELKLVQINPPEAKQAQSGG